MSYAEPTNAERAERGGEILDAYAALTGDEPDADTLLRDCLADLMHWCARTSFDFDEELDGARSNFDAEKGA